MTPGAAVAENADDNDAAAVAAVATVATVLTGTERFAVAFVGPGIVDVSGRAGGATGDAEPPCAGGAEVQTGPAAEALPGGVAAVGVGANDLEVVGEIQLPRGALVRAEAAPIVVVVAVVVAAGQELVR